MKTTIDLDEAKLLRVMRLTGIKTRKEAIDFALNEAERAARIRAFLSKPFYVGSSSDPVAPDYDVLKLRKMELGETPRR
jgi:Arc/MetJ family transcription regulator